MIGGAEPEPDRNLGTRRSDCTASWVKPVTPHHVPVFYEEGGCPSDRREPKRGGVDPVVRRLLHRAVRAVRRFRFLPGTLGRNRGVAPMTSGSPPRPDASRDREEISIGPRGPPLGGVHDRYRAARTRSGRASRSSDGRRNVATRSQRRSDRSRVASRSRGRRFPARRPHEGLARERGGRTCPLDRRRRLGRARGRMGHASHAATGRPRAPSARSAARRRLSPPRTPVPARRP